MIDYGASLGLFGTLYLRKRARRPDQHSAISLKEANDGLGVFLARYY